MSFAGFTRPALRGGTLFLPTPGEMRHLEFHTPTDFHGIQCGIGTVLTAGVYDKIKGLTPDPERALAYVQNFDLTTWQDFVRSYLGRSGEGLVEQERKEQKYSKEDHKKRLEAIVSGWGPNP